MFCISFPRSSFDVPLQFPLESPSSEVGTFMDIFLSDANFLRVFAGFNEPSGDNIFPQNGSRSSWLKDELFLVHAEETTIKLHSPLVSISVVHQDV